MAIKKISFNLKKSDHHKPYYNKYCPTKIYSLSDQELLNIMFNNILNYYALSMLAFRILVERKYIKLIIQIDQKIIDPNIFILFNSEHKINIDIMINNDIYPIIQNIIIKNNVESIDEYYSDDESKYRYQLANNNIDYLRIEDDKIKIHSYRKIIYDLEKKYYTNTYTNTNNYSSYNIFKYIAYTSITYYMLKSYIPFIDINYFFKQKLKI